MWKSCDWTRGISVELWSQEYDLTDLREKRPFISLCSSRRSFLGRRCSLLFIIAQDMRFSPLYSDRKWLNREEKSWWKVLEIKPDKKRSLGYWQEATENSFLSLWSPSTEYMLVVRMAMKNQTFLLSTLYNQGRGGFIHLTDTTPRWPHRVYVFVYKLLQTRKWGFLSLINSTSARSDSHGPRGCQRAQTSTEQLSCRRFFTLRSSRDMTADSLWESLPHCPLQKLAASSPIGITTLSPYLKSSAPLTKVLFSHGQPLPENRRSFGNKPGLSRTNPSKPCVRLFLSSVHGYLKVAGNCMCVHAAICSGTYVMRGPVLNLLFIPRPWNTEMVPK